MVPPPAAPTNPTITKEGQQGDKQEDQSPPRPRPRPRPPPSPPPRRPSPRPPPSPSGKSKKRPPPPPHTPSNKPHPRHSPPPPRPPPPKSNTKTPELPPASKQPHKPPAKKDDQSNGNSSFTIGAVIGAVLLLVLVGVCASVCYCYKKKKKEKDRIPGYFTGAASPRPPKPLRTQLGQPTGNKPRPPGLAIPVGLGWHGSPAALSSDMSSSFHSGPHGPVLPPPAPPSPSLFNKSSFTYEELAAATDGFSESNLIGQGGFGYVYKGTLLTGKDVAVKQLKPGSGQGEREFQAEVEIISRVHHRHLVSLVGYCIAGAQRILIYEFVPNKTLEYHLHRKGLPVMDWPTRIKIALGSAKGLAYLHEDCHPRIIHRDIKTANILIDYNFEAMVADFGLAKLSSDTHSHVSTRVMGTFGYLAPEYASTGKLTDKSDVYSYGVMLLELITGRRPVDNTNRMEESCLVDWARPTLGKALADENYGEVVDPRLEGNYNPVEMKRMITCGAACVRQSARRRPRMSQVVRALEGDMISFDDLSALRPGQSSHSRSCSSTDTPQSDSPVANGPGRTAFGSIRIRPDPDRSRQMPDPD